MTKRAKLNDIVKCCELRFNHGDSVSWKHGEFIGLHKEILRDTGVNISPNTLKRIFGKISVDEDYIPQQATLDALKSYGRYVENDPVQPSAPAVAVPPVLLTKKNKKRRQKLIVLVSFAVILLSGFFIWKIFKPIGLPAKIRLVRTEGHLPATASFELQLPESDDSLFVNFGDKSPLVYVVPGETKAAHIYYFPGLFTVSIQTRRQPITSTVTYVRSDSWIGLAFHNQPDIPNQFFEFPAYKTGTDSLFKVDNHQFFKMGLDTTGLILTRLCNFTPVAHSSDDFIFEAIFQNSLVDKSIYCRGTQFQVSGSNSMIRFKFVNPGCSLRVINYISEQTFKGSTDDLSQFVVDLRNWNTVKLINHHKHLSLYINGKKIFSGDYKRSLGELRGIFLEFEGAGLVKKCELKTYQGKLLYSF